MITNTARIAELGLDLRQLLLLRRILTVRSLVLDGTFVLTPDERAFALELDRALVAAEPLLRGSKVAGGGAIAPPIAI